MKSEGYIKKRQNIIAKRNNESKLYAAKPTGKSENSGSLTGYHVSFSISIFCAASDNLSYQSFPKCAMRASFTKR